MQYSDEVVDHTRNPRNFGEMDNPTHEGKESNATCGDMIELYLKVEDEKVKEAKFRGVGCAMSTAMASMLTEKVKGMSVSEVKKLDERVVDELMGEVNPGRMKCVMLPVVAVKAALE